MNVKQENQEKVREWTDEEIRQMRAKRIKFLKELIEVQKLEVESARMSRLIAENNAKEMMWKIRHLQMLSGDQVPSFPEPSDEDPANEEEQEESVVEKSPRIPRKLKEEK